jgi:endonuclease III-like uncharacterized protein
MKQKREGEDAENESEICTAMRRSLKQFIKTSGHYKIFLKVTSLKAILEVL